MMELEMRPRPERYLLGSVDVDRTTFCGKAQWCEMCELRGHDPYRPDLTVATYRSPVGVVCFTVCQECVDFDRKPNPGALGWEDLIERNGAHAHHLGLADVDQLAAAEAAQDKLEGGDRAW